MIGLSLRSFAIADVVGFSLHPIPSNQAWENVVRYWPFLDRLAKMLGFHGFNLWSTYSRVGMGDGRGVDPPETRKVVFWKNRWRAQCFLDFPVTAPNERTNVELSLAIWATICPSVSDETGMGRRNVSFWMVIEDVLAVVFSWMHWDVSTGIVVSTSCN